MIAPEVMAALKSTAQRVGDLNLEALQKGEAHVYVDLAILAENIMREMGMLKASDG